MERPVLFVSNDSWSCSSNNRCWLSCISSTFLMIKSTFKLIIRVENVKICQSTWPVNSLKISFLEKKLSLPDGQLHFVFLINIEPLLQKELPETKAAWSMLWGTPGGTFLLYFLFTCNSTVQSDLRHNHLFFSSSSPGSRVSLWGPALVNMILPQDRFHLHKNNRKTEK